MTLQIVLMRHGRPLLPRAGWVGPAGMAQWIAAYDRAEVPADSAPAAARAVAASANCVVSSTLERARSSALALGVAANANAVFCETTLPHAQWALPRLPAGLWAGVFRLLWLAGYASHGESLGQSRERAAVGAQRLIELALQGPVLLVGHGIMNRLIARELRAAGWRQAGAHPGGYWGAAVYRKGLN